MKDWNVVATTRESHFHQAIHVLKPFGQVSKTHFRDVVVMRVDEPREFLQRLHERLESEPEIADCLGHVAPCTETFSFQSPEEFATRSQEIVRRFVPEIAGKLFHVRMHRRGFQGRLHSTDEEQRLDRKLLDASTEAGNPSVITFDDPDVILAVESVDSRAGMALWTREDLQRYSLLQLD